MNRYCKDLFLAHWQLLRPLQCTAGSKPSNTTLQEHPRGPCTLTYKPTYIFISNVNQANETDLHVYPEGDDTGTLPAVHSIPCATVSHRSALRVTDRPPARELHDDLQTSHVCFGHTYTHKHLQLSIILTLSFPPQLPLPLQPWLEEEGRPWCHQAPPTGVSIIAAPHNNIQVYNSHLHDSLIKLWFLVHISQRYFPCIFKAWLRDVLYTADVQKIKTQMHISH